MCQFKSYIVTNDLKIHGSLKTCRHEDLLAELKLEDLKDQNTIQTRKFVRVEVTPKNKQHMTRNLADWVYREDEEDTLPEWYRKNKSRIEEAVFLQLTEDLKLQVAIEGEEKNFTDIQGYAVNPKKVCTCGSSNVEVYTHESSNVEVNTHESSNVKVNTHESSNVKVYTYGSSNVEVNTYGSSNVEVCTCGSSNVEVCTCGSSNVEVCTYGSSNVEVCTYGSSNVKVYIQSSLSVVRKKGKIYVNTKAEVVAKDTFDARKE